MAKIDIKGMYITERFMNPLNKIIAEKLMTQSIDEEIAREQALQIHGMLNRIEDLVEEVDLLTKRVMELENQNRRLKWSLKEQD